MIEWIKSCFSVSAAVSSKQKSAPFSNDDEKTTIGIVILPEVKDESSESAEERARILKEWCS